MATKTDTDELKGFTSPLDNSGDELEGFVSPLGEDEGALEGFTSPLDIQAEKPKSALPVPRKLFRDEQGILRVSLGRGPEPPDTPFTRVNERPFNALTALNIAPDPKAQAENIIDDIVNLEAYGIDPLTSASFRGPIHNHIDAKPYSKDIQQGTREFVNAISTLGAAWQYDPNTEINPIAKEEIDRLAREYRKAELITDEELEKQLADPRDIPSWQQIPPEYMYDKTWAERASQCQCHRFGMVQGRTVA
ncbi:MAG: hypothetical protein ACYTEQ_30595 [Planctomycetota bacterium]|jgi:hypothetical protein